jgi:DNA-binding response OmpR family regulator
MGSVSFAGHSVLIVEDEPLLALDLRQSFEAAGAYVFAATQFAQALTLAIHPDLSLAVLDYRIGEETSDAVCRHLEARGTPFLFYSAYGDMLDDWPDAVLVSKPSSTPLLLEQAAAVLRSRDRAEPHVQPASLRAHDRLEAITVRRGHA